ncbi:hypothetical protein FOZ63_033012, partial [Perkinsus olseni]
MSDAASPVSADRGHQKVPAGALTTVDRANTGLTKEYKRRLRRREKPFMPVIIEETEEETDEDEHAPRIGNLHRPSQGNHLAFLRRGLSRLESIATDVGKDFEGLQMVFARRAAARQCEDPKSSFIATLVEELGSLSAGSRLAVAKYLHVLVVTDASSAACFGRAPNGLRLLVQILSNDQDSHKYVQ